MIPKMNRVTVALTFFLLASAARAEEKPLAGVCGGMWSEVDAAANEMRLLPAPSAETQQKLRCVLAAITELKSGEGEAFDKLMLRERVALLIGVVGAQGLDFFAEVAPSQRADVRSAIESTLLQYGHPAAFRRYFELRRSRMERGEHLVANEAATAIFTALVGRAACAAAVCSSRIPETLQLVAENADIVDLELMNLEQALASRPGDADARSRLGSARTLREMLARVRNGESRIGAAALFR